MLARMWPTQGPFFPSRRSQSNSLGRFGWLLLASLLFASNVAAQVGTLDGSFSSDGKTSFDGNLATGNLDDSIGDSAMQIDNKIVLVGSTEFSGSDRDILVVRVTTDGILDTTFNSDGIYTLAIDAGGDNQDQATAVTILADGRILVAGWARTDTGIGYWMRRLLQNGNSDPSFMGTALVTEVGLNLFTADLLIEPSGSYLLLVGTLNASDRLYRYSADGSTRTLLTTLES